MHRKFLTIGVVFAALATAATAAASQTNIFGGPGTAATLAPNCARTTMFLTPAGKTWDGKGANGKKFVFATTTVLGSQIKCLIHRVDKAAAPDTCFSQAGPVPATSEAPADKQGYHDTKGLDALAAWAKKLQLCEAAR